MNDDFEVVGENDSAAFTLKVHRGEGMALLGMNWRVGRPPDDFVGFAIQYREPGGDRFLSVRNRLTFEPFGSPAGGDVRSSLRSPIQKFRWVHFPFRAERPGGFLYRVTPVFMAADGVLSYGEAQEAEIDLAGETYPGRLNVCFTRGFVSSQAFVDRFERGGAISTLLPAKADDGLDFVPTHPDAEEALDWMGFEARRAVLAVLDAAIADETTAVKVVAYDLSEADVVSRLEQLGSRLTIIVDDSDAHGEKGSAETEAARRLRASAGTANVRRQHMGGLQHNKCIVVTGPKLNQAVCGSTNFSWRGFFVQSNNAVVLTGRQAIQPFVDAFESYWGTDEAAEFGALPAAQWVDLGFDGIEAEVAFSPHSAGNAQLATIAGDIREGATSSLLYSLAFLAQTKGSIRQAVKVVTEGDRVFVYGIADRAVGGIDLQKPDGNVAPVSPAALSAHVPEPFKSEPTGGGGIRMHHKFVVVDFDLPTARVYLGSYNFSKAADRENGENLLLIRDRRVAVSYAIEAVRLFDHYEFRLRQEEAKTGVKKLVLQRPPSKAGATPWWLEDYTNGRKARDRLIFS
ncbi:phospholipase D-like domain-containing protein [Aeromicrobium sp. 9AM]|uniref:phospholipase D-like domain-containing protein n=1 Tax=Aeromicrobium sp. 9AM TaxID=2653126 RepID=UPI0012F42707|nr:phospholipase D-like domain-containing protein [Aeromicrobium sp. 9AM]VXB36754.1 Phospholipase [Aeromicrobium sp. 9AM]